jgi:PAS domain S-box-containing protein
MPDKKSSENQIPTQTPPEVHSVRLEEARLRVAKLHQRADYTFLHQSGLLPDAFEELHTTIEELRVAEEEMRAQNEELLLARQQVETERHRYQDLFEFAPDGYLVTTLDGKILEANQEVSRLLNIAPRYLKSRSFGTSVAPEDLAAYSSRLRFFEEAHSSSQLQDQAQEWIVHLRRRRDGLFPAAVTAVPVAVQPGETPTLRWLIRDITERRQAEEERLALARAQAEQVQAEASERQTSAILDTITDPFVTLDREWRFTYLNASAAYLVRLTGRDPEALLGQVIWDAYPTALGTGFQMEALRAVETGCMAEFEEFSHGLGRWIHARIFPSDSGVVAYTQDVTARKEAEIALQAACKRERRIADTLQAILLHTAPLDTFLSVMVETFCEAASEEAQIGGDFFDVFGFGDGFVALVVGDVSGKGLTAATLTAEVKYALRVFLRDAPDPALALARLNDFLCEAQRQGDFASDRPVVLSLATLDPPTGETVFLSAGGEPLLLLRAHGGVETSQTEGLMLGIEPGVSYAEWRVTLAPGDTLLMVTDGLTEACRDGELLGFPRLTAMAAEARQSESLRAMGQSLLDRTRAWAGGKLQDDTCLLLARRLDKPGETGV